MSQILPWPFGRFTIEDPAARAIAAADLSRYGDPLLVRELKRYLLLRKLAGRPITMQSKAVDEVWHRFILDTVRYRAFCDEVFGGYLDHVSAHFELDPEFPASYSEAIGEELPEVWTEDARKFDAMLAYTFDHNCA